MTAPLGATAEAWAQEIEETPLDQVLLEPEYHDKYHRVVRALRTGRRASFIERLEQLPDADAVRDELRCWYLSMLFATKPDRDELIERALKDDDVMDLDQVRKVILES